LDALSVRYWPILLKKSIRPDRPHSDCWKRLFCAQLCEIWAWESSDQSKDFNLKRVLFCGGNHGRLFQHNRPKADL